MSKWRTMFIVAKWGLSKSISLWIAILSLIVALGLRSYIPLAVGLAAELGVLAYFIQSPRYIQEAMRRYRWEERDNLVQLLEQDVDHLDVESRARMRSILQLYKELYNDTDEPDVEQFTASTLRTSLSQVGALTEKAFRLARKKRDLQRYLDQVDEGAIADQVEQIRARLELSVDSQERSRYEQALRLKSRELEDYKAIAAGARRIDGELENVECAFESLRARIVRLKAADATQWSAAGEQLRTELDSLSSSVETLEQSVNEALSI